MELSSKWLSLAGQILCLRGPSEQPGRPLLITSLLLTVSPWLMLVVPDGLKLQLALLGMTHPLLLMAFWLAPIALLLLYFAGLANRFDESDSARRFWGLLGFLALPFLMAMAPMLTLRLLLALGNAMCMALVVVLATWACVSYSSALGRLAAAIQAGEGD